MVDGHLLHGNIGRAGHLGHISLDAAGRPDIVETPGSLEDQVGDATIGLRSDGRYESTQVLVTAVREGDEFAVRVWQESIRQLAAGIVSLINVLDPEVVILGGGITRAGHALFGPLRTRLAEIEWRPFGPGVVLVPAALDEFSGAAGAARFAMTFHQRPFREGL
jgi:glucokinase